MRWLRCLVVLLLGFMPLAATAQPYPARPVRILIPFTAGSAADIIESEMQKWAQVVKASGARAD